MTKASAPPSRAKVLLIDTLSSSNDFGVDLAIALSEQVELTIFTIKGTRLQASENFRLIAAFPEYFGSRSKAAKLGDELRALHMLIREVWRHRRDTVHVQFFRSACLEFPVYFVLRPFVRRLVLTVHNALPHERRAGQHFFYRIWYSVVDCIHVLSDHTGQTLVDEFGVDKASIVRTPHGNYNRFLSHFPPRDTSQVREALGVKEGSKLVLFFGLIREYKGVFRLLEAIPGLESDNVRVIISGGCSAPLAEKVQRRIDELGIEDVVEFNPEYLENQRLSDYLAAADLVVFPYENISQSGALLLAMTYGKAVVVSDLCGFREYVQHGETGWICDTSNPRCFSKSVDTVLLNPSLARKLGENAKRVSDREFSWRRIASDLVGTYQP
jgi:glycosyltransferase involved in cell wall biosynthesis